MKKILLAMALSLSFAGASHATDEFIKKTLKYCSDNGGTSKIEKTSQTANKECFKILCYKAVGVTDVNFGGTIDEIRTKLTGAGAAVLAFEPNACRDYKEPTVDDLINGSQSGAQSGSASGAQSGSASGAQSGSASGAQSGSASGAQSGSASGAQSGSASGAQSGSASGAQAGAASGVQSGANDGAGGIRCEFVLSGSLSANHPCIKKCRKNFWGKEGIERKSCRECIEQYSTENGGDLVVDWDAIIRAGGKKPNKSTVKVTGVQVRTGEIICYDVKTGAVVTRIGNGSLCPSGSSTTPGGVVVTGTTVGSGSGNGNGTGTVVINTGNGGNGNGNVVLPPECRSTKKKDKQYCENWMRANARFACASSGNPQGCMGDDYGNIQNRYNYDGCVNCGASQRKDNSWIGEAISGGLHAVAQGLTGYWGAKAYENGQKAWAGAAATGFEQCTINNNNYLQYLQANELAALSPEQQAAMGCNGYQLSQYAGMGAGGMGGWYGAGYTPGYLGGMMGPYGGYNPYGGGMVGGAVGGYVGGMAGGYPGGYAAGMQGGYVAGMQGGIIGGMVNGAVAGGYVAGGMQAGYPGGYVGGMAAGYPGGYAAGGMAAGYPGGYVGGGYVAGGMAAGYPGGYAGGYPGGYAAGMQGGGLIGGIQIAGGMASGYNAGYNGGYAGGYMAAGYASGYNGGYMAGGFNAGMAGGGYLAGGIAGGYNPGGGYYPGGWGSGTGQWGGQGNYWAASQQTSSYDQMLQGQGISYQMGMGSGAYGGGYGGGYGGYNPGYSPMNMGGTFGAQLYGGMW